ncbi:MAG: aminopeptidase P N-terminal domain-containing protein [Pseudomonadota bacterium]|nr:aminopeptidase P N-terminal domain-containing protein [Pseudomonadota bacterium]
MLKELTKRRGNLFKEMKNNSAAIFLSARKVFRNKDVEYNFHQNSDFLYMCGINEPDNIVIFVKKNNTEKSYLWKKIRTDLEKTWEGSGLENQDIIENYGFTEIDSIENIYNCIDSMLSDISTIYFDIGTKTTFESRLLDLIKNSREENRKDKNIQKEVLSLGLIIHKLRLRKSPFEIDRIKEAVKVSSIAHEMCMKKTKPGLYEYEISAELSYIFNKKNMTTAYPSIVASGANACVLHYTNNNSRLNDNDLLLIDAAAENEGYSSDITRTFPINGKFSAEQSLLYEIVLNAQKKSINEVKPGSSWEKVHSVCIYEITCGLMEIGILSGNIDQLISSEAYKDYYMHKTGHWLGLDVHDVGEYKNVIFEPGMVMTIEPGIYVSENNELVDSKWRGIGIRIEDDILVTDSSNDVISSNLVKELSDIEDLCS